MTVLLVASTGGHLAQLHQLRPRLVEPDERVRWVTFDTPQSRSLLAHEDVSFVPYVAPRGWQTVLTNSRHAHRILRSGTIDRLITTGSGMSLSFLPLARARGIECRYIESAARSVGPSVSGRLAALMPGVQTFTQYDSWTSGTWRRAPSVFDDFRADDAGEDRQVRSLVVSLGTIEGYGFRSLVERLLALLPADVDVLWQTGDTDVSGLPVTAVPYLPQAELVDAMRAADAVVTHAGIGSALGTLKLGKVPVLVPRRAHRKEHVDDHQVQIARELSQRGLAVHRELDDLQLDALAAAARGRVRAVPADSS